MTQNLILQTLCEKDRSDLLSHSAMVNLNQHDCLYRPGRPIEHVYFVQLGLVSLLMADKSGHAIETGTVGREGVVGGLAVFGSRDSNGQANVGIKGCALSVPMAEFLRAYHALPALASLVNRHANFLLFQAQQNALCHALHSIEARFCRWLLQTSDVENSNVLDLTQELCSQMLGVQRTSISMVAHGLQLSGFIRTRRGRIEIMDRAAIENVACECYRTIKHTITVTFADGTLCYTGLPSITR